MLAHEFEWRGAVMKSRRIVCISIVLGCGLAAAVFHERVAMGAAMVRSRLVKKSVADRLAEFGAVARGRMQNGFSKAGVPYPPIRLTLLVLKEERRLEVYGGAPEKLRFIHAYPILAASGVSGPKLREGDRQVPEGIYAIESLNPNSSYHVSLRLNYPNEFDRAQGKKDGRTNLGGDIMIHGKAVSIGCVALGDTAAEEIFTLAADTGLRNITVLCSPVDWRKPSAPKETNGPAWTSELYAQIQTHVAALPAPSR
jgi:hypothetical protein